jgi:CRP/FNR family transcriptional regulator, cyclic AMP receptor protein
MQTMAHFDPEGFLATAGPGHAIRKFTGGAVVFAQGDRADDIFYILEGKVKITVVSHRGKEAVVGVLMVGQFFGEEVLNGHRLRIAAAVTMDACTIVCLARSMMLSTIGDEPAFAKFFIEHLLSRNLRIQEDLVDHLFNSSEKRLARTLLLLSNFGKDDKPKTMIAGVTQETLAEMIGTTRSRVSFFMNKFRKLGFIEYNGKLQINPSLLNIILHE